ncbi:MAG TPA: rRNA maturation RNase YbeY [Candidatus Limnocylindrales bacterium]|nr:rRNA maturation RNase YbeY [Candidatus Limnocylindrales bacterium]
MSSVYLAPWRIDVTIRDAVADARAGRPAIAVAPLTRAIAAALSAAGAPSPASVGLILSDDAELASLNATHLGEAGPTDVLSFPLLPPDAFPPHDGEPDRGVPPVAGDPAHFVGPPSRRVHLGDIVVSVERARAQADGGRGGQTGDVRWSVADELRLLVTHGTLHVCGWDHADPAEEAAMRALEQRLLGSLP